MKVEGQRLNLIRLAELSRVLVTLRREWEMAEKKCKFTVLAWEQQYEREREKTLKKVLVSFIVSTLTTARLHCYQENVSSTNNGKTSERRERFDSIHQKFLSHFSLTYRSHRLTSSFIENRLNCYTF